MSELLLSSGVEVDDAEGLAEEVTTGVGVTNGVCVEPGVFETPKPQVLINEFNFIASFASTVKEYLAFIAIQFSIYVHCSLAGNQRAGSLSPLERLVESVTAINVRASSKSFVYA